MLAKNTAYWVKTTLRIFGKPLKKRSFFISFLVLFSSVGMNLRHYSKKELIVFRSIKNYHLAKTVLSVSKEQEIDPLLVTSIILSESSGYPYAVSHMKAKGLMQLMPSTALYIARAIKHPDYNELKNNPAKIYDVKLNLELAIVHLKGMFAFIRDDDWKETLHIYNLGTGAYKKGQRNYHYVNQIMARLNQWQDQI